MKTTRATNNIYKTALAELGTAEYPTGDNPRIVEYHNSTSHASSSQDVAWCASFVCWILEQNGIRSPRSPRARSFADWGVPVLDWKCGDVVLLSRGTNPALGHVGFYMYDDQDMLDAGYVMLLGGNQWDSVCPRMYDASRIVDVRRADLTTLIPNYDQPLMA